MTDVMFLMMLIVVVLIPMAGLFPLGHVSLEKSKNVSCALYLAQEQINQLRVNFPTDLIDAATTPSETTAQITVGDSTYDVTRRLWTVETRLWTLGTQTKTEADIIDVEIIVTYPRGAPFEYSTRLYADATSMASR